jgi:hypothetical protein
MTAGRLHTCVCLGAFALLAMLGVFVACGKRVAPSSAALVQKITAADQLITGIEASGRVGDYLLSNGRVRFVVEDAGSATGWGLYGGSLVDLDRVRAPSDSIHGDDRLQEIFYQCNLRGFEPTKAEIINDGRDGNPGVLRLSGHDRGIPLIDAALPSPGLGLEISVDYSLSKDGDTLEIILRAKDVAKMGSRDLACGVVLIRGDYDLFADATGFDSLSGNGVSYLAAASAESTSSYVFYRKSGDLVIELQQAKVMPISTETVHLPGGGTLEEHFFVSVGSGDVESALAERRRILADGTVRKAQPIAVSGPSALASMIGETVLTVFDTSRPDGQQALTSVKPDTSGNASVALPPGNYKVSAIYDGRAAGTLMLAIDGSAQAPGTASLALSTLGVLEIDTVGTDKSGAVLGPTPAKLTLIQGKDQPATGARVVEKYLEATDAVIVPAGDYTAYVSRGPEYELHRENVTIAAGGTSSLHAKVAHVVDTTGWISADLHVHSAKSVDADSPRPTRVLGAIAEGVEILVSTDHDIVTDYTPFVHDLGLDGMVKTVMGTEVSPAYGHINAFPLVAESPEAYWRVTWYLYKPDGTFDRVLDPAEIVQSLRAIPSVQYIQCNHPRSGQGVFNYIRLDPMTGASEREFPAADGFEILNARDGKLFDQTFQDFITLIKANKRMTGTGVSDAHCAYCGVGYARTMIRSSSDDPSALDMDAIFRALREGRVVALSGPMVTLHARQGQKTAEIGDTLSASGPIQLEVHIEAPSWMDVSSYKVLENGSVLASGAIASNGIVRLDQTFTATVSRDAFYLVIAEGAPGSESAPVLNALARTVTNPVFVDADGDGFHFKP